MSKTTKENFFEAAIELVEILLEIEDEKQDIDYLRNSINSIDTDVINTIARKEKTLETLRENKILAEIDLMGCYINHLQIRD